MIASVAYTVVWLINWLVFAYFILLSLSHLGTSLLAFHALRRYSQRLKSVDLQDLLASAGAPPITLVVPAFNEEATCVEAVRSLLTLNYPEYEIVVVNDGSRDRTRERLIQAFEMAPAPRLQVVDFGSAVVRGTFRSRWHPNLWLVDKDNGGKADALNAGLSFCQTPLFCAMDADTLLERDALLRIVRPFLEDQRTVAAGGLIRVVNGCTVESGLVTDIRLPRSWLARFQVLEYLRAFLAGRMGWHAIGATLVISGAFGVFRRSVTVDLGGFRTDVVGEDMELVMRMHRRLREQGVPYRISFVPDPVAWTEAPETLSGLGRQRDRWQRGMSESLAIHRRMLLNPAYGRVGLFAVPHFFFLEMLGPLVELVGYFAFALTLVLGWANIPYVIGFLMVAIVLGIILSVATVALEEVTFRRYPRLSDLARLFYLAVLENFGYRQLVTFWRVRGTLRFLRGEKAWGEMTRKGFGRGVEISAP
jgi:cellulose synthase/poly-beta-1,6-N-acetylglucosamine synthase-like glycosyltransferase